MRRWIHGLFLVLALGGCAQQVVWKDRATGKGDKTPVPTCPHCGDYADWESDRCKNPSCGRRYRWWEPEVLK